MSEKIDWSKAPEDATHYHAATHGVFECWLKPGHAVRVSRRDTDWREDDYADDLIATSAIKRPWSGEGLPPVGVVCEAGIPHTSGASGENRSIVWIEGRVIAYHEIKGRQYAWFAEDDDGFYPPGVFEFRPLRTPEQIAADEREAAILDMDRICRSGDFGSGGLAALYDAGYRKEQK